jgi:hypothetical protein
MSIAARRRQRREETARHGSGYVPHPRYFAIAPAACYLSRACGS